MDDTAEKLSAILNDEESISKIKKMAESLLSQKTENEAESGTLPDAVKIAELLSRLKQGGGEREALLLSLKPYLKEDKREKIDFAVKIIKIIELLPFLKESGILDGWL